jgi:hypothetical protein
MMVLVVPMLLMLASESDRLTDCQSQCDSVCLVVEPRLGLMTRYSFLVEKSQSCPYGAPSLTRGRVCHLSVIVDSMMLASWRPAFLFRCCWTVCGPVVGGAEVVSAGWLAPVLVCRRPAASCNV